MKFNIALSVDDYCYRIIPLIFYILVNAILCTTEPRTFQKFADFNLSKIEVRFSIFLKGATNSSDIVQIYETSLPL